MNRHRQYKDKARRYDDLFLEQFTYMAALADEDKQDQEKFTAWFARMEQLLNAGESKAVFSLEVDHKSASEFSIVVSKKLYGVTKTFIVPSSFFVGKDYLKISQYAQNTADMFNENSYMQMGERQQPVRTFKQAFEWMMKEAKKGQHIQRYKGLGEMNPEQLWETTLDSNNRRLLQVRIEDAIAADEIFTTLMGDVVEPRRDFIVKNALDVTNLDV
jgi:DNA gyrase subunit B